VIGAARLAWRRIVTGPAQTALLAAAIALTLTVPVSTELLVSGYEHDLRARAATTPMVAGAAGSRFELLFGALYFRRTDLATVPYSLDSDLRNGCRTIPLRLGYTIRGVPVVGVGFEYFGFRSLALANGALPTTLGDAVLGASAAQRLKLAAGDAVFNDQPESYDLTAPAAVKLHVVGVLAPTGSADDDAVFVDVRTSWLMDGRIHGHVDAKSVEGQDLLARDDEHVVLNQTLIETNEVTPESAASFHLHGEERDMPISAVIVLPESEKAATMTRARVNATGDRLAIVPSEVVEELLAFVFRIKAAFDALSVVLGVSTLALLGLIAGLTWRVRSDEARTLALIGVGRGTITAMYLLELAFIVAIGLALGAVLTAGAVGVGHDLIRTL